VPSWNEPTAAHYRQLEHDQRVLAQIASSEATRDIHLEFAERYRKLAEELESAGSETDEPS
jgi:hypothetical protein